MTNGQQEKSQGKDRDQILSALLKDYEMTCLQIHEMVSYSERNLAIGLTLAAAFFSFGIKDNISPFVVVMPLIGVFLLLFVVAVHTAVFSLAGYRKYIETKINELCEAPILNWENVVPITLHKSWATICLNGIIVVLIVISMLYGALVAKSVYGMKIFLIVSALYIVGSFCVLIGALKLGRTHQRAFELATNSWKVQR